MQIYVFTHVENSTERVGLSFSFTCLKILTVQWSWLLNDINLLWKTGSPPCSLCVTEPPLPCLRSIWKRYQEYFGVSLGENCTCSWSVCSCCVGKGWISSYKLLGWFLILPASTGTGFFREALPCSCLGVSLKLCLWQGKPSSKCQAAWCLSQPKSHSLYYLFPVHLRRGGIEWRWGAVGVQPGGLTHRHVGRCGVLNRLGCILTTGRRLSQELLEGAQVLSPQAVCCQPSSSQA